jgi:hypothetical protein
MAHAVCSPSGAVRWMNCPGSVREEARYPEQSSVYAQIGILIHEIAAQALLTGTEVAEDPRLTPDQLRIAADYVAFVRGLSA